MMEPGDEEMHLGDGEHAQGSEGRRSSWRGWVVGSGLGFGMVVCVGLLLVGTQDGETLELLGRHLWKAPEMELATTEGGMFRHHTARKSPFLVQLDSARPLLSSKAAQNLAELTAAMEGKSKKGGLITLKNVPTLVTMTIPEDVTISMDSVERASVAKKGTKLSSTDKAGEDEDAINDAEDEDAKIKEINAGPQDGEDSMNTLKKYFNSTDGQNFKDWCYGASEPSKLPPSVWFLHSGWEACRAGRQQSPVNIVQADVKLDVSLAPLEWTCGDKPCVNFTGNSKSEQSYDGHMFKVQSFEADGAPQTTISGEDFAVRQILLHTPSENTVNGMHYDMEVQIVHNSTAGNAMVVSVMFTAGEGNESPDWVQALSDAISPCILSTNLMDCQLSAVPTHITSFSFQALAESLMDNVHHFFRYQGSMTSPPCSEGVMWNVLRVPLRMAQSDWTVFAGLQGKNNRPTQLVDGRVITML